MELNTKTTIPAGFLLIDKPKEWTSHDVVGYLRGALRIKKIGHAGTLDPFATGLLIVGVGREATKRIDTFRDLQKTYEAIIMLGASSDTQDKTGSITKKEQAPTPTKKEIETVLHTYIGEQTQIPPMYSAKKIKGKKLYELAREGKEIERAPHDITIHSITLISYNHPHLEIRVTCSKGTYIRTLAHDIGKTLKTDAYCEELRRTAIGTHNIKEASSPKEITLENYLKMKKDINFA